MCEHGNVTWVMLHIDARVDHAGRDIYRAAPIDSCIAMLVKELDDAGYRMTASCCGHTENAHEGGSILFTDRGIGGFSGPKTEVDLPTARTFLERAWASPTVDGGTE